MDLSQYQRAPRQAPNANWGIGVQTAMPAPTSAGSQYVQPSRTQLSPDATPTWTKTPSYNGQAAVRGLENAMQSTVSSASASPPVDATAQQRNGQQLVRQLDQNILNNNKSLPWTSPSTQTQDSWFANHGAAQDAYDKQRMQEYAASQSARGGLYKALDSGMDTRNATLDYTKALSKPANVDVAWGREQQSRSLQNAGLNFVPGQLQTLTPARIRSSNNATEQIGIDAENAVFRTMARNSGLQWQGDTGKSWVSDYNPNAGQRWSAYFG